MAETVHLSQCRRLSLFRATQSQSRRSRVITTQILRSAARHASRRPRRNYFRVITTFALFFTTALASEPFLPSELLARVKEEYGRGAERSLLRWQKFITKNADSSVERKLQRVNLYFNVIPYASDSKQWGVSDYWATPVELLVHDRGDCEDYAIAKYFTLRKLGIPAEQLRVIYVHVSDRRRQWQIGNGLNENLEHMVLGFYETPTSAPLILDNLTRGIQPASERPELKPVFSFHSDALIMSMLRKRGVDVKYRDGTEKWYDFMLRI